MVSQLGVSNSAISGVVPMSVKVAFAIGGFVFFASVLYTILTTSEYPPENLEAFKKGKVKIANKLGEEAVETVTAYLYEGKKELLEESADLIFHLLVLLEDSDLTIEDVEKTLKRRMKND